MSEESVPKKKAARKTTRKRTTAKKAAKKAAPNNEEQLPLTEETPSVLPGESLSFQPPSESNTTSVEAEAKAEVEASPKKPPRKSRVRDARRDTSGDITEVSEPLIKETSEDDSKPEGKESKDKDDSRNDRPEKSGRRGRGRGRGRGGDGPLQPRPEVDFDQMRKKAWKIFHSEVTEEGLALLDDKGLRDFARSSLNAARIFLEEEQKLK